MPGQRLERAIINHAREKQNSNITQINLVLQKLSYQNQSSLKTNGTDLNVLQQQDYFLL